MNLEHIPIKIRHDAASSIFMRGSRLFQQAVEIIGGKVKSRNKLRSALYYFEIADSIIPEATNLNFKGLCQKFLGRYEDCIQTYRRFLEENGILCNDGDAYKNLANETIAYCKAKLDEETTSDSEDAFADPLDDPDYAKYAQHFGEALMDGDYESAHSMLSNTLKSKYSKNKLQKTLEKMIANGDGDITSADVVNTMDDWPGKKEYDLGWAYLALTGNGFSEAVTVVISREFSEMVIRDIEWGRP